MICFWNQIILNHRNQIYTNISVSKKYACYIRPVLGRCLYKSIIKNYLNYTVKQCVYFFSNLKWKSSCLVSVHICSLFNLKFICFKFYITEISKIGYLRQTCSLFVGIKVVSRIVISGVPCRCSFRPWCFPAWLVMWTFWC